MLGTILDTRNDDNEDVKLITDGMKVHVTAIMTSESDKGRDFAKDICNLARLLRKKGITSISERQIKVKKVIETYLPCIGAGHTDAEAKEICRSCALRFPCYTGTKEKGQIHCRCCRGICAP